MTLGFIGTAYGMYALYLYKRSGGDYPLKCGVDFDKIEAKMVNEDKENTEGVPVVTSEDINKA